MVRVSEKGQVTIPKEYRERFGLRPGDEVEFVIQSGELVVRKETTSFDDYSGYLSGDGDGTSVDERMTELRGEPDG